MILYFVFLFAASRLIGIRELTPADRRLNSLLDVLLLMAIVYTLCWDLAHDVPYPVTWQLCLTCLGMGIGLAAGLVSAIRHHRVKEQYAHTEIAHHSASA